MTIGKSSRKSSLRSSIRAPKFLDKSSGFYGRLDEPKFSGEEHVSTKEEEVKLNVTVHNVRKDTSVTDKKEEADVFGFNEGMMEDDGETLLQRNTSRRSNRWRRSSRRKQKEGQVEEGTAQDERPSLDTESRADPHHLDDKMVMIEIEVEKLRKTQEETEKEGRGKESSLVHFSVREEADDQVLIRDKKRGRDEEGEDERRMEKEQEEGMKMLKGSSVKNYRKVLDRAFRRGWEAFITNLYSVTLTPVTSSSPKSSSPACRKAEQHNSVLAEFH